MTTTPTCPKRNGGHQGMVLSSRDQPSFGSYVWFLCLSREWLGTSPRVRARLGGTANEIWRIWDATQPSVQTVALIVFVIGHGSSYIIFQNLLWSGNKKTPINCRPLFCRNCIYLTRAELCPLRERSWSPCNHWPDLLLTMVWVGASPLSATSKRNRG